MTRPSPIRLTPQATGLWKQLEKEKHLFSEPRGAGDAFDKAIAGYYKAVKQSRGGLFLAVCRGKVCRAGMGAGRFCAAGTDRGTCAGLSARAACCLDSRHAPRPRPALPTYLSTLLPGVRGHRLCRRQRARGGGAVYPLPQRPQHPVSAWQRGVRAQHHPWLA